MIQYAQVVERTVGVSGDLGACATRRCHELELHSRWSVDVRQAGANKERCGEGQRGKSHVRIGSFNTHFSARFEDVLVGEAQLADFLANVAITHGRHPTGDRYCVGF